MTDYPFTTRRPLPGMMEFENVQIQLVDLPPLSPELTEPWLSSALRGADLILLLIDLSQEDVLEQVEQVKEGLARWKIVLGRADEDRAEGGVSRRALLVGNKLDAPGGKEHYDLLREIYREELPLLAVSALKGSHLEELKRAIYQALEIVRVYTKPPGKEPNLSNPAVLKRGSTIEEVAASIHKDFAQYLTPGSGEEGPMGASGSTGTTSSRMATLSSCTFEISIKAIAQNSLFPSISSRNRSVIRNILWTERPVRVNFAVLPIKACLGNEMGL